MTRTFAAVAACLLAFGGPPLMGGSPKPPGDDGKNTVWVTNRDALVNNVTVFDAVSGDDPPRLSTPARRPRHRDIPQRRQGVRDERNGAVRLGLLDRYVRASWRILRSVRCRITPRSATTAGPCMSACLAPTALRRSTPTPRRFASTCRARAAPPAPMRRTRRRTAVSSSCRTNRARAR